MISVFNALQRIDENTTKLEIVELPITESLGQVVGEDLHSNMNMPPFRQSAMDGYAMVYEEALQLNGELPLVGESKAGSSQGTIQKGTANRIFTGAMVPEGADTVVIQENVHKENDTIKILDFEKVKQGANIRPIGDEIQKGELIFPAGSIINPASIGLLISLGVQSVRVHRNPKIAIIVTGDELKQHGSELQSGEVFESNSFTLRSALNVEGLEPLHIVRVEDNLDKTIAAIDRVKDDADIILSTGGISVGDYDFIGEALKKLKAQEIFYKVKQKPGKPLFYGKINNVTFFGLPGNPGSVLSCFYIYVLPAIRKMQNKPFDLGFREARLKDEITIKGDKVQFQKGIERKGEVKILNKQSSSMLHSFSKANCLVMLEPENPKINKGERVKIIDLPFN